MDICEDASMSAPEARTRLLVSLRVFLSQLKHDSATVEKALENFESERLQVAGDLESYFSTHPHEGPLFENSLALLSQIASFPLPVRLAFSGSLMDMALGMESEIAAERTRSVRHERSTQDFEQYCYTVAGTVGIFLTQVFWDEGAFEAKQTLNTLEKLGESFGEALQIVNITKDFHQDWKEGRCYWPRVLSPGGLDTNPPSAAELLPALESLKRHFDQHLGDAKNYVSSLSNKRNDIRFFCEFPLQMAEKTMTQAMTDKGWLETGVAPKISKAETLLLAQKLSLLYALPALWNKS